MSPSREACAIKKVDVPNQAKQNSAVKPQKRDGPRSGQSHEAGKPQYCA